MTKTQDIIDLMGHKVDLVNAAFDAGEPAGAEIDAIWRLVSRVDASLLRAYDVHIADVFSRLPHEVSDRLHRWLVSHSEGEVALFWRHFEVPVAA